MMLTCFFVRRTRTRGAAFQKRHHVFFSALNIFRIFRFSSYLSAFWCYDSSESWQLQQVILWITLPSSIDDRCFFFSFCNLFWIMASGFQAFDLHLQTLLLGNSIFLLFIQLRWSASSSVPPVAQALPRLFSSDLRLLLPNIRTAFSPCPCIFLHVRAAISHTFLRFHNIQVSLRRSILTLIFNSAR